MNNKVGLEQNSSSLYAHGSYINDWKDAEGMIFRRVFTLSKTTVLIMLAEAMAGVDPGNYEEHTPKLIAQKMSKRWGNGGALPTWLDIQNKDFVLFRKDDLDNVYGFYKHDFTYYLISAKVPRLKKYLLDTGNATNLRLMLALEGKFTDAG